MAESDFSDLLQAAERLACEVEGNEELPRVDRTLRQVLEASNDLWSRVTHTGAQDVQANLLLGTRGVDLPELSQKLEVLSARKTFEPLEPIPDTDVHNYLRNESENAILSLIEETYKSTLTSLDEKYEKVLKEDWFLEKFKLMNSLIGYSSHVIDLPVRSQPKTVNEAIGSRSLLDWFETAYSKHLIDYNIACISNKPRPNLAEDFLSVAVNSKNDKIINLWQMVNSMIMLPPQNKGESLSARLSKQMTEKMISQAKNYLENRYKDYMKSVVSGRLEQAQRGGVPGTFTLVRSFVAVLIGGNTIGLDDTIVEGQPVWPMIYYCLRCGDIPAAIHCATLAGIGMEEFIVALNEMKTNILKRVSDKSRTQIRSQYRRSVRHSSDPFKRAVYCVIGACDVVDEHKEVAKTADDYLWIKLSQVAPEDDDKRQEAPSSDKITFSLLQTLILEEYGETYYNAQEQPHVYAQMLILTGQFESAIEFLMRNNTLKVHAVHIAILLYIRGLLSITVTAKSPLLVKDPKDPAPMRRLNLARVILLYARRFDVHDIREALHYYYVLRELSTPLGDSLFSLCVSNLILETREFDLILGKMEPRGDRKPGLIDEFSGDASSVAAVMECVAAQTEAKGQFEDAIKIYDLVGNHEKVLTLMNTLMCQVVHRVGAENTNSLRSRLSILADDIGVRYSGQRINAIPETVATFHLFKDLYVFFDYYYEKKHNLALEVIQSTQLIPMTSAEVPEYVSKFEKIEEPVVHLIPEVLVASMSMIHAQYSHLKKKGSSSISDQQSKEKTLEFLRERAKALTTFAGSISYRMSSQINSKLVQMELMMH